MGSYISVLYINYNRHIYSENQYADLFTYRRKGVYVFSRYKYMIKVLVKGYEVCDSFMIKNM